MNMKIHTTNHRILKPKRTLFLALFITLLGYSSVAYSQADPVVTVRFANPHYECLTMHYCVDVEFMSNTPGVQVFGMNVRFFYPDNILELLPVNAFSDFQG